MLTDGPIKRAPEELLRQACAELDRRLRAGERYSAEDAFAAWPDLAMDADSAVELIFAEFTLREALGQTPSPENWYSRFPQWRKRLQQLFDRHRTALTTLAPSYSVGRTMVQPADARQSPGGGPGTEVGPYELLGEIGRGGMGVVYKARHQRLNRVVALKMILSRGYASAEELGRFRREAEAVAHLQHPHIVQVFEVGEHCEAGGASYPYMALEFVPGGSLAQRIAHSPQPPHEAARLVEALAGAVQHAHDHGVVHRDLKPGNILLTADGTPKVTDFGLAKRLDATDGPTYTGAVLGTPGYMAPEQAAGDARTAGPAADVYALGAILYEMLTGRPPFLGADWVTVLEQVRSAEPVPLVRLQPGVPRDLETVALKCLEKQPGRRYPTAAALAEDLRRFLDGRSVLARPPNAGDRLWKFLRRNRGPAVAALLVLGTLVGGVIGTTWQAIQATQARKIAEANEARATEGEANALAAAERERAAKEAEAAQRREALAAAERERFAKEAEIVQRRQALAAAERERLAKEAEAAQRQEAFAAAEKERAAAQQERVAKEAEAAQRQQAEAVTDLLLSVFAELDPEQGDGDLRTQLVRGLDAVAAALDKDYKGDPLVRARLRDALGKTQEGLGEYPKAIVLHRQAFDERRARLGPEHPDTLTAMSNLAVAYHSDGRLSEALPLYEQALAGRTAKLGPDHSHTLMSLCNLAAVYHHVGRVVEAVPLYEKALAGLERTLGPDHLMTLRAMDNLAVAYHHAGRLDDAVPLYEQALARRTATLGPDHPDTLSSINGLAGAYRAAGRTAEAVLLFERAVKGRTSKLGRDHPDTLASMVNLALTYHDTGRLDEAVTIYEQALTGQKRKPGPDHPHTLTTMHNLAAAYEAKGRLNDAVPLYEQALAGRKVKLGADHADTLITTRALALAYENQEKPERAEPLWRELLPILQRKHGPESAEVAGVLTSLGTNLFERQQFAGAEAVLRDGLAIRRAKWPDDYRTFYAQSLVGASLLEQKKAAEAEPFLREGYAGLKQRQSQIPAAAQAIPAWVAGQLVRVYEALGQPARAAEWRKEVESLQRAKSPVGP